ncbi:MAG TPA: hypothetical protein GX523_09515, partial [Desulfitobacterium dehalogenans]|nr:hypothetical protein [Desulfitobacterium dehalogenans]
MDQPILSFLQDKSTTHQNVTNLYKTYKDNYNVQVKLLENTRAENKATLKFQVITTYNLLDSPDVDTEVSDELYVLYDYDKKLITDFYTPYNYYDLSVRDQDLTLLKNINQPFSLTPELTAKMKELKVDINKVYKAQESNELTNDTISTRTSFLRPESIVIYARHNYNRVSPYSGNGRVPYLDFSLLDGAHDCTNFVSHALLAGGAGVYDTGGSGISSTGWYYRDMNNRSSSWAGVNELYTFLTTNRTPNTPSGISNPYTNNIGYWSTGDILQLGY